MVLTLWCVSRCVTHAWSTRCVGIHNRPTTTAVAPDTIEITLFELAEGIYCLQPTKATTRLCGLLHGKPLSALHGIIRSDALWESARIVSETHSVAEPRSACLFANDEDTICDGRCQEKARHGSNITPQNQLVHRNDLEMMALMHRSIPRSIDRSRNRSAIDRAIVT